MKINGLVVVRATVGLSYGFMNVGMVGLYCCEILVDFLQVDFGSLLSFCLSKFCYASLLAT